MPEKKLPVKKTTSVAVINPQQLLSKAIEKNLSVETMERLLAMRRELKAEAARDEFFYALSQFQKECPEIKTTKKVYEKTDPVQPRQPRRVRYAYAPLNAVINQVKVFLEKHGFSYIIKAKQNQQGITAICEVHHVSGHHESTEFTIPIVPSKYLSTPQSVASALTFAKRYAFCNAFGIVSGDEDDDAQLLNELVKKPNNNVPSEEGTAIYQGCISLLNLKERSMDVFTSQEKIQFKTSLDALVNKLPQLKEFYQNLNQTAQDRIRNVKGENNAKTGD